MNDLYTVPMWFVVFCLGCWALVVLGTVTVLVIGLKRLCGAR